MGKNQIRSQTGVAMVEYAMLLAALVLSLNVTIGATSGGVSGTLMEASAALGGGTQRDNFLPEEPCESEGDPEEC